jgi:flavodoxin
MQHKKTLIICQSIHHGNTLKIANIMAKELNAELKKPSEITADIINEYDVIGFGSGIYNQKHHVSLFNLVKNFSPQKNKKCFIFSTASISYKKLHEALRQELISKGFIVIDEFICRGFMDYSFIKYLFGGINKNKPNDKDLKKASEFAIKIGNTPLN